MMDELKSIVIAEPDIQPFLDYEKDFVIKFRDRALIQVITEREYLENYFRIHREIDVLLVSEKFYGDYLKQHRVRNMLLLDGRTKEEIFAFVENALSGDEEIDEGEEGPADSEKPETKVVSVYSPIGGCGKSIVCLALAKKLKKLGESVLVIGCDDMQSMGVYLETRDNADPDMAVKLSEFADDTYWSVLKNIYTGDVACLLPFEKPLSALGIGAEQMTALVNLLKEKQDFSYIILDLGSVLDTKTKQLCALSDAVVLVEESKLSSCRLVEKLMYNIDLFPADKLYILTNQYRTEGFRIENDNVFGSFAACADVLEAMEEPVFYRLALELAQ